MQTYVTYQGLHGDRTKLIGGLVLIKIHPLIPVSISGLVKLKAKRSASLSNGMVFDPGLTFGLKTPNKGFMPYLPLHTESGVGLSIPDMSLFSHGVDPSAVFNPDHYTATSLHFGNDLKTNPTPATSGKTMHDHERPCPIDVINHHVKASVRRTGSSTRSIDLCPLHMQSPEPHVSVPLTSIYLDFKFSWPLPNKSEEILEKRRPMNLCTSNRPNQLMRIIYQNPLTWRRRDCSRRLFSLSGGGVDSKLENKVGTLWQPGRNV
ncbi:hypothetical protein VNO77_03104 [Canavalia gladiata]|uniref:Uncharacterized protein n=1 Tax=Canavalia gladiata TaxID=3824 RepID=A0AAN9N0L5_CANGL